MLKLLFRTIGLNFYQRHAGLFLVIFYLLFGAVEGSQLISYHTALLLAICSSPLVLLLLFAIWILYAMKCVFFVKQQLDLESYSFAKNITCLTKKQQLLLWAKVYIFLLLPICCYAVLMLLISLKHSYYLTFGAVLLQLFAMVFLLSFSTFRISNYTFNVPKQWIKRPQFVIKRPFWTWALFHLLNEQRIMLLLCKVVSVIFLKAILLMFADVGDDIRVYLTAAMAVVLSHSVLLLNLVKFDAGYLSFAKGLPISSFKKLVQWFGVLIILLLPEMVLLFQLTDFNLLQLCYILLYFISSMFCLLALVYWLRADMDRYLKYLLFFFFVNMLAILAAQYLLFSLLLLSVSVLSFLWQYQRIDLRELA